MGPINLNSLSKTIKSYLDDFLWKFNPDINGIPFQYEQESIVSSSVPLSTCYSFLNITLKVKFLVIRVKIGQTLIGKITKITVEHIEMLVLSHLNAKINGKLTKEVRITNEIKDTWCLNTNSLNYILLGTYQKFDVKLSSNKTYFKKIMFN